jgi:hypothetical protein
MGFRLVTCPESAHLERIEYAETECGLLILGCSRFDPPCEASCPRTCAARLDRRARLDLDEHILAIGDDTSLDVLARLR